MIGRLTGSLAEVMDDGSVILDVAGVGYEVFVPLGSMGKLPAGGPLTLHVHTHVREEAITLFGFANEADRKAFRALLGVSSVGPKLALAILGRLDAIALAEAVAREDKASFKGISGVGQKTVERILIDLKGKLPVVPGARSATRARPEAPIGPAATVETVVGALVNMGYKRAEVERALDSLPAYDGLPVEALLRETLAALR
ncbi:MAG: Holliday junction branch migration protein RuvA [Polyangiaceae bacterium]|nr:Holliday junction branch migration protein RuvA [Polyangiaceae bacterium]